jgi:anti-sigma regulatory factor (Ser/Thr protein kinase)
MSNYYLNIPRTSDTTAWYNFINTSLKHTKKNKNLIVDFNTLNFLDTDDFVVLACLIESFYRENCTIAFTGGSVKLNKHLDNIRFKEYWEPNFNRESFTASRNHSTLCLWKISKEMIYSYSQYANKYFRNTFMNDKDLVPLSSNLDEVFNNVFDHANSPVTGYIIMQYYPANNRLSFSVCDFGIGIPSLINEHRMKKKELPILDSDALALALNAGFSVNSTPRNRGMGLNNIKELVESSEGVLTIASNNGIIQVTPYEQISRDNKDHFLPGTLVKVELDMNTFDAVDIDDEVYDF